MQADQVQMVKWPLGGGEIGLLIRNHPWHTTPLGPIDAWPQTLRTTLNLVLASAVPMMLSWGLEGISFCNDAFATISGAYPGELLFPLSFPFPELTSQARSRALLGETFCLRNQTLRVTDCQPLQPPAFDLACSPVTSEDGHPAGLLVVVTAAPATLISEAKLHACEASQSDGDRQYRALFNSIDAAFCIIEVKFDDLATAVDYRFLEVNPAFSRHTGIVNPEGQWMRDLAPDHESQWFDIYGQVATTGTPIRFENRAAALADRWFEVYAFRIGNPGDRRVAILFSDITSRKKSETDLQNAHRELLETSHQLQRSNEDLEQFARVAGHDLRAPLRSIVHSSQLLERWGVGFRNPDARQCLHDIIESGKQMTQLIDDLFRYATAGQNPQPDLPPIQANHAYAQARNNLRVTILESGSIIDARIADYVLVRIELSLLTQVFQNLIENAIHYRREGPKLSVRATAVAQDGFWQFAVADNGEGIDERYTRQIFEPFRRLHGSERPGSGIGLATCKRIVERAGGSIWVQSQVGAGSTFYFSLPQPS